MYPLPYKEYCRVLQYASYAQAEVSSLLTSTDVIPPATGKLDKSRKLCSSKTKNNLAQDDGSLDNLIGCKLDHVDQIGMIWVQQFQRRKSYYKGLKTPAINLEVSDVFFVCLRDRLNR